jgi:predicted TIM-barrel fold metal-dependent hydrolase
MKIRILNVCITTSNHALEDQKKIYRTLAQSDSDIFNWCTSFALPDFSSEWSERVIQELEADFSNGARACKFWKNLGMEVRKPDGEYLRADDPLLFPVYRYLESCGLPALMHIGEPLACWQPLDETSPHYWYYSEYPEWHLYGKPGYLGYSDHIAARDHILELFPGLRIVGAHLGSLEHDVGQIADRLDRYPNFHVDTSARIPDLADQDRDVVREFLIRYQDRVLYGTDFLMMKPLSAMDEGQKARIMDEYGAQVERETGFLSCREELQVGDRRVRGLGLPAKVVEKILSRNAQRIYAL